MNVKKWLAGVLVGSMLTGVAALAVAAPASATDEGTLLPGGIYWFNTAGPLSSQSTATQIKGGQNATGGGNLGTGRPWATLTTENPCPAGTAQLTNHVRIPTAGQPEANWPQVSVGANTVKKDADGRFYTDAVLQADRLNKAEVMAYLATQAGNTATIPFISVCRDNLAVSTGYFRTMITFTGTTGTDLVWSIDSPTYTGGGTQVTATTTSLVASAAGADLTLTATVTPAAAAGTVTFTEGATTLGTAPVAGGTAQITVTAPVAGSHTYAASFAPTDAAAYGASNGSTSVVVGIDSATGLITVTVPAAPVVDGALTFAVPFGTPVALVGARSGDNTRVTATAAFPTVTVTDTRRDALLSGWEVNVQATDFVGTGGTTIGAKYLGWVPGTPSMTPDAGSPLMTQAGATVSSYIDNTASAGLGASSLLGKSVTPGRGVTTLGAALNLAVPGETAQGSYTSTVTVTLVAD